MDNNEIITSGGTIRQLMECEYFSTLRINVKKGRMKFWCDNTSFHSLLVISGSGFLENKGKRYDFLAGDSLFLPAGFGEYFLEGESEILLTKI